jgi:hypothetical protein
MRGDMLEYDYWPVMCERMFQGMNMNERPKVFSSTVDQGGRDIA